MREDLFVSMGIYFPQQSDKHPGPCHARSCSITLPREPSDTFLLRRMRRVSAQLAMSSWTPPMRKTGVLGSP